MALLGVPLRIVQDTKTDGRERYEKTLVLIRPDNFVAWVSDRSDVDAMAVLQQVTARS
ncbi:MAG: hypothetical protein VYE68_00565 [Acidobacteriota bacterium]|nr:hypothetical protein [Acidobacteriota bacterium]